MTRDELYAKVPYLLKRLAFFGLPGGIFFLVLWYLGGANVYGALMQVALFPLRLFVDLAFEPGAPGKAVFVAGFLINGTDAQVSFPINLWNLTLVQIVTLFAAWEHKGLQRAFSLALLCLLLVVVYHGFNLSIQIYEARIGPNLANQLGIFWENTAWYQMVRKLGAFDEFILRYWMGIPIFFTALVMQLLLGSRQNKQQPGERVKQKRSPKKNHAKS